MWLLLGGGVAALVYFACGIVSGITYVGIPFAKQQFHLAKLCLQPFGKNLVETKEHSGSLNKIFYPLCVIAAATHFIFAAIDFSLVVGIVFGEQHLRMGFCALDPITKTVTTAESPLNLKE